MLSISRVQFVFGLGFLALGLVSITGGNANASSNCPGGNSYVCFGSCADGTPVASGGTITCGGSNFGAETKWLEGAVSFCDGHSGIKQGDFFCEQLDGEDPGDDFNRRIIKVISAERRYRKGQISEEELADEWEKFVIP